MTVMQELVSAVARVRPAAAHRARHVLLLDEGWAQTLELAAALHAAGHRVTVLTASGRTGGDHHGSVAWRPGPALASPALVPHLERMIADAAIDDVVPLTEAAMARLWDAAPAWAGRIFPATAAWQRRLLRDKYALSAYLAARGVAIPRHRRLTHGADPASLARELGLPLVVKGAIGVGGARVRIVDSIAALARALDRARQQDGAWGVQEFVEGPTALFGGVFHDGEPLRIYAGDKLEQHPPRIGPAIRMRSRAEPTLVELGTRIVRALRWTGFASVDFIRRRDGRYVFLEVNPRLWGSAAAARASGVDLFTPFAELLAGDAPAADLAFLADRDVRIFPRYLLSPRYWTPAGAALAVRDLFGVQGRPWRDTGFLRCAVARLRALRRPRASL